MSSHAPHSALPAHESAQRGGSLPTLQLPPAPFGSPRGANAMPEHDRPLPSGTSVNALIDALRDEAPLAIERAQQQPPREVRPHADFHVSVERRSRQDRRATNRHAPDRRTAGSPHLAAPDTGPLDPRPLAPPPTREPKSVGPLDARLPELPAVDPLEPARPWVPANRGVAAAAVEAPAAAPLAQASPAPAASPTPAAPPAPAAPAPRSPVPVPVAPLQLDAIYGLARDDGTVPVGRLDPWPNRAPAPPVAGPAGPGFAPGAGLEPAVATAAAAPSAWYGGKIEVDDAMLVWNAPAAHAAHASAMQAFVAQPAGSAPAPAAPGLAITALSPGTAAAAGADAPRGAGAALLRVLLLVGLPAGGGIGIAFALERFVL